MIDKGHAEMERELEKMDDDGWGILDCAKWVVGTAAVGVVSAFNPSAALTNMMEGGMDIMPPASAMAHYDDVLIMMADRAEQPDDQAYNCGSPLNGGDDDDSGETEYQLPNTPLDEEAQNDTDPKNVVQISSSAEDSPGGLANSTLLQEVVHSGGNDDVGEDPETKIEHLRGVHQSKATAANCANLLNQDGIDALVSKFKYLPLDERMTHFTKMAQSCGTSKMAFNFTDLDGTRRSELVAVMRHKEVAESFDEGASKGKSPLAMLYKCLGTTEFTSKDRNSPDDLLLKLLQDERRCSQHQGLSPAARNGMRGIKDAKHLLKLKYSSLDSVDPERAELHIFEVLQNACKDPDFSTAAVTAILNDLFDKNKTECNVLHSSFIPKMKLSDVERALIVDVKDKIKNKTAVEEYFKFAPDSSDSAPVVGAVLPQSSEESPTNGAELQGTGSTSTVVETPLSKEERKKFAKTQTELSNTTAQLFKNRSSVVGLGSSASGIYNQNGNPQDMLITDNTKSGTQVEMHALVDSHLSNREGVTSFQLKQSRSLTTPTPVFPSGMPSTSSQKDADTQKSLTQISDGPVG